jgi:hypothetical protein
VRVDAFVFDKPPQMQGAAKSGFVRAAANRAGGNLRDAWTAGTAGRAAAIEAAAKRRLL